MKKRALAILAIVMLVFAVSCDQDQALTPQEELTDATEKGTPPPPGG